MMEISTDHIGSYRRVLQLRVRKEEGGVTHNKNMAVVFDIPSLFKPPLKFMAFKIGH